MFAGFRDSFQEVRVTEHVTKQSILQEHVYRVVAGAPMATAIHVTMLHEAGWQYFSVDVCVLENKFSSPSRRAHF